MTDSESTKAAPSALPRLLVIDDEPMLAEAIRRMLFNDAQVTICHAVEPALVLLAQGEKFDAILCDLMLPGTGGIGFHAELERSLPRLATRLGFVTGGASTDETEEFVRLNKSRVLDKPFTRQALLGMVKLLMV